MRAFNLHTAAFEYPDDNPGVPPRPRAVGEAIGSQRIGGTVYELPPGESAWPYHYELGDEEWMIVLDGRVEVRTPEGEQELGARRRRLLPRGPRAARTRWSTAPPRPPTSSCSPRVRSPAVAVYPDSQKVGVFGDDPGARIMARRESNVDYWDGEAVARAARARRRSSRRGGLALVHGSPARTFCGVARVLQHLRTGAPRG